MVLKDIRIFLLLLIGIFLGQTMQPIPQTLKSIIHNKYFQFFVIFAVTFDIYDFKKKCLIKSAVIAITILLIFELLRNFDD